MSITGLVMGDAWKDVTEENYFEEKDRWADHLVYIFERVLDINVRDYIEKIEEVTHKIFKEMEKEIEGSK
ncbi:MAG TPA: hypothetical protein GXX63_08945 [Tissierellia bacterium]|nr:hypothetical protein [Tissierellia bacterium]